MTKLTETDLLQLHASIGAGPAGFRCRPVFCTEAVSGRRIAYIPHESVPVAVRACLVRVNAVLANQTRGLDAVRAAAILWAELLSRIHPFVDGNGRVVRALCAKLLAPLGFEVASNELLLSVSRTESLEDDIQSFQAAMLASLRPLAQAPRVPNGCSQALPTA